jgi:hypothetical protein
MALVNPIRNNLYSVTSGLLVTNSNTAAQAVATGYIADRSSVSGTISAATIAGLYTTGTTAHGLNVGDLVTITGVSSATGTTTALSGTFVVQTVPSTTTFTVTTSGATGAVTIATGAAFTTADIKIAAGTVTPSAGTSTGGPNGTSSAFTTANQQRYDVIAIDVTTGSFVDIQGTVVASTGTPVIPPVNDPKYLALAVVLISSTDGSTVTTSGNPIDVRSTYEYAPVRAFNRSQNVRIGGNRVTPSNDVYVAVDNQVARKELGYHSAIGSVYNSGPVTLSNADYVVHYGGVVTAAATGATVPTISGGELLNRLTGTYVIFSNTAVKLFQNTSASQTALIASDFPVATSGNVDHLLVVNKFTGILSVIAGTSGVAGTQVTPTLTSAQQTLYVPLAVITKDTTQITNIRDVRPRA